MNNTNKKLKNESDEIGFHLLEQLGFEVKRINESDKQEADFIVNYKNISVIIEAKLKIDSDSDIKSKKDQLEKNGSSIIDNKEGYSNTFSGIIRKSSKQSKSSSENEHSFKITLLISKGINAKTKANIFQDTLYGRTSIIIGSQEKKCYFFSYSEFIKNDYLDGSIISYIDYDNSIKTIFCINPYSKNYNKLKKSKILELFNNSIIDPIELEQQGLIYIVDKYIDRKLTDIEKSIPMYNPILNHIKDKYKIDEYIVCGDFNAPEITTIIKGI
jgi:hypothetical protein